MKKETEWAWYGELLKVLVLMVLDLIVLVQLVSMLSDVRPFF